MEAANIPPSEFGNDLCSTRQTLALFRGNLRATIVRRGGAGKGLSEGYNAIVSWN